MPELDTIDYPAGWLFGCLVTVLMERLMMSRFAQQTFSPAFLLIEFMVCLVPVSLFVCNLGAYVLNAWQVMGSFPVPSGHHPAPLYLLVSLMLCPLLLVLSVAHLAKRRFVLNPGTMGGLVLLSMVGSLAGWIYQMLGNGNQGIVDYISSGLFMWLLPSLASVHLWLLNSRRYHDGGDSEFAG